ncbi:hypothetical protein BTO06_08800 [Tenacibaculum sp. SZ-18]|uniref:TlpA family protein disulfide reductase n=1 Tax=Tenacibaculum sp. SZ-18 TaxID=754423 RepID=UPI000C2D5D2C|nr:thioredoxin-like domain-containing protein [Tenacibaculum sp. SZ-18]AUC15229.1 hypothetical protein BTO06_08800 [Tenacibaculum sp. SZ-18]
MKKTFFIHILLLVSLSCVNSKKEFYAFKTQNGQDSIIKSENLLFFKEKLISESREKLKKDRMDHIISIENIKDSLIKTINKGDSVLYYVQFIPKIKITQNKNSQTKETTPLHREKILARIGEKLLLNELIDTNNKVFNNQKKPSFLYFWANDCPASLRENHLLNKLYNKYNSEVNFISFTKNSKTDVYKYLENNKFMFRHFVSQDSIIKSLDISEYPTILYIDKANVVKFIDFGLPQLWKKNESKPYDYDQKIDIRIENLINQ